MPDKNTKKEAKKETKKETKETAKEKKHQGPFDEFGNQVEKFAVKTADSIRKVIDKALASRNTVLTIRVNDESNISWVSGKRISPCGPAQAMSRLNMSSKSWALPL